jgi:hypothetical protein
MVVIVLLPAQVTDATLVITRARGDGRLMKEWVVLSRGKENWIRLAREAHHFASGDG